MREIARPNDPEWRIGLNDLALSATTWVTANTAGLDVDHPADGRGRRFDALVLLTFLAVLNQGDGLDVSSAPRRRCSSSTAARWLCVWGILMVLYFVMLGGIGGKTPGAFMTQVPATEQQSPLQLPTVLGRALLQ